MTYGPDSFTFKVNDGEYDSVTATVTITIASVKDAPVASTIADVDWLARVPHSYVIPAFSDVDGDTLTYSAIANQAALPVWLSIDPVTGAYTILVIASDGHRGTANTTFTLTVTLNPFYIFLPAISR